MGGIVVGVGVVMFAIGAFAGYVLGLYVGWIARGRSEAKLFRKGAGLRR